MSENKIKQLTGSLNEINETMNRIKESVREKIKSTPGTMNLAEIMNRHHLENQHSNIIGFLVDPEEKHHHPEYGKQFIQLLKEKGLENIKSDTITYVKREESTDESRRIDLFIKTKDSAIIVENKIYAGDQQGQILDYIKFAAENEINFEESNVFVVYLTLDDKSPNTTSLPTEKLEELKKQHRYINLTYKTDVLSWLEKLVFKQEIEEVLKSAVIQYMDIVKGLTRQRKEMNMKNEIAKEVFNAYAGEKSETIKTMLKNVNQFNEAIRLTVYIKFFEDLYEELKEAEKKGTLYCNDKEYQDKKEWEDAVTEKQIDFGVCYQHPDGYTEALIVDNAQSNFVFAVKYGRQGIDYEKVVKSKSDGTLVEKDGYQAAAVPGNWFLNAVLCKDFKNGKTWEELSIANYQNTLAKHIALNWF